MFSSGNQKYKPYIGFQLKNRTWPSNAVTHAPIWSSVDLRDGNQALPTPMTVTEKFLFFNLLVKMGFKHIEIGFPSSSQTEFNFIRTLIETAIIPNDVYIQLLMPAREEHILRTFDSIRGAKKAIIHFYTPTSLLQRSLVFNTSKKNIIKLAVDSVHLIKKLITTQPDTQFLINFSPESFSSTEPAFALEVANAVIDATKPTPQQPLILDLPATMEVMTPNHYADLIEYMNKNLNKRASVILSIHTHNDRGTAVAASELGLLAGAQRVAGTLFGNGERSGNADIITLAMNMLKRGIDPQLDLSNHDEIKKIYTLTTKMIIPETHPFLYYP